MIKPGPTTIVLALAAITQVGEAQQKEVRLATAPNNEYALQWTQPAGPLRVFAIGNQSAKPEIDISAFGHRFGDDPTAVPLSFISPDSNWLLVVAPPDSFRNPPDSFNQPALLLRRSQSGAGAIHFQPAMQGRFEKTAWEFLDHELNLKRADLPGDAERVYSAEFIDWSQDSARLLMKIGSGAWSSSKREWVQSVYRWYCYFNTRSGKFDLTERLRFVDSKPELNGTADDPAFMTVITTAEPIGREGPVPNRKDRFDQADKRLNDAYGKLITQIDPSKREPLREEQRAWLVSRDTEAQVDAIQVWSSGTQSAARILESKALATEARVAELEKRLQQR